MNAIDETLVAGTTAAADVADNIPQVAATAIPKHHPAAHPPLGSQLRASHRPAADASSSVSVAHELHC